MTITSAPDSPTPTRADTPHAPIPSHSTPDFWAGLFLLVLAGVNTICWLQVHQWYGLLKNRSNNHFSFEKIVGGFDSTILRETLWLFIACSLAFAALIFVLGRVSRLGWMGWLGLLAAIGVPAAINIYLYPVGALDVFNYMIELKLAFHYDQNPYLVTFENYRTDSYAGPAFLVSILLFYGPAWLVLTGIPAIIVGFDDIIRTLIALKVFNALLIALTAAVIYWHHRHTTLKWLAAAMFAASPLVLFEGIANGHNDVLLTAFLVSAVVALERRSPLAGPLLALSALVKLYTVALLPIFIVVALSRRWGWKRVGVTVALTAVVVAAFCAPYWGEGKLVDGLRAGLEESQEMDHVSPLSLARQYAQHQEAESRPDTAFALSRPSFEIVPLDVQDQITNTATGIFVGLALLLAVAVWRGRSPALASAETLLLLFLLMTNLYGWYLLPVFGLLALRPDRLSRAYVVLATGLGLAYYPMFVYGHYNSGWSRFQVHQFLALFLVAPIATYLLARLGQSAWNGWNGHQPPPAPLDHEDVAVPAGNLASR